jgi:hypothetical protein
MNRSRQIRQVFYRALFNGLRLTWPILSALIAVMVGLGLIIGHIEHWELLEGVYFAFVTGLTVGYGDLVPKAHFSRIAAIVIGFNGILLTGIVAAISVHALQKAVGVSQSLKVPDERN